MEAKKKALQSAINNREIIKIRYGGGHHPGSVREIAPVALRDEIVFAICIRSDEQKNFALRKLEIVSVDTPLSYDPEASLAHPSLIEISASAAYFRERGWQAIETKDGFSTHKLDENGNLLKCRYYGIEHLPHQKAPWKAYAPDRSKSFRSYWQAYAFLKEEESLDRAIDSAA